MTRISPDLEDAALMRCSHCRKESNNQRVCPHCFMPYGDGDPRTAERTTERVTARPTEKVPARATEKIPARPTEKVPARPTARVTEQGPPRGTTATARRAAGDLPPVGSDAAMDRALSGLSMDEVMPESEAAPTLLGRVWRWYRGQTPIVRRLLPVILFLSLFALIPIDQGEDMGPGVTVPKATPDAKAQAESLLAQTRERATIEQSGNELVVTYAVTGFPGNEEGRKALAEAFARADALVEGRRRTIYFYTPQGQVFAKSDSVVGVMLRK